MEMTGNLDYAMSLYNKILADKGAILAIKNILLHWSILQLLL